MIRLYSLQTKIVLWTTVVLCVCIGITASLAIRRTRRDILTEYRQKADALSSAMAMLIQHVMMVGAGDHVQSVLEELDPTEVGSIELMDEQGRVVMANQRGRLGTIVQDPRVQRMFSIPSPDYYMDDEQNTLVYLYPQVNGTQCQACHKGYGNVIGALRISMPSSPLDRRLRSNALAIGFFATAMLVVVAALLAVLIRRIVIRPIQALNLSATRIAQGELSGELPVRSDDEIGRLADTFRTMQHHLQEVAQRAMDIARGNIGGYMEGDGELGQAVDSMVQTLRGLVDQLRTASKQIQSATGEIHSAAEEQASGAEEQVIFEEQISGTVEELSITARQIAESRETVSALAEETRHHVDEGQQTVAHVVQGIHEIRSKTEASVRRIGELGERSEQIGEVLELINGIAAETRMLSLNAAIEAAKAGEHGRGFSVVATEIRQLAERVVKSTETIKGMIAEIQSAVTAVAMAAEEDARQVTHQTELAGQVSQFFEALAEVAQQTAQAAQEIAISTDQQREASEQVASTMGQMVQISRQSAAAVRQTTASVHRLQALAEHLQTTLGPFMIEGSMSA